MRSAADIEGAFAAMTKSPPGALIIPTDRVTLTGMRRIVELVDNLKTAKTLEVQIPPSIVARADRVIE